MHPIQRAFYEVKFLSEFLRKNATEFQTFFEEIMEKGHPGDFQRIRPWGNIGDRKNDGYLRSKRCIYQVYAPNDMKLSKAIAKIQEDFNDCLPYWKEYLDEWVFVHNAYHGLAPDILAKLLELESNNDIRIGRCGFEELRIEVFRMDHSTIASLLGPAPSSRDMMGIGFEELRPVIVNIARHRPTIEQNIQPVPADKLVANGLSDHVEDLIRFGMYKASLVERFLNSWHDPTLGDAIAQSFRNKYNDLKGQGFTPDEIFCELQIFAGGERVPNPATQSSVLAVMSYLFERCHIYEASRTAA